MDEQLLGLKEKEPKKTSKAKPTGRTIKEKSLLLLELAEIKEISDKLFDRIEKKIEVLKALEASVDEKIVALKKLGQEGGAVETPSSGIDHKHAVISLKNKGLGVEEIAGTLGIPIGEVELILNLNKDQRPISADVLKSRQDKKTFPKEPRIDKRTRKIFSRKVLWTTTSLLVGLIIFYIVFLQGNNTPSIPQNGEQMKNVLQQKNPEADKTSAVDLIRQKYNVSSDTQSGKQIAPPEQRAPHQNETPIVKGIKQKELKKTITIIANAATIRANPSLESQPVAWVSKGVVFEIKEEFTDDADKKWYKIVTSEGKKGWIADKVVKESL
jgi:hypothetical protein